ncbi:MAG TPA: hypothetical protein VJ521_05990, partial [Acidobacteriota bacterium]|nr:hypothetical protein [Acidobacteriota bacterium]
MKINILPFMLLFCLLIVQPAYAELSRDYIDTALENLTDEASDAGYFVLESHTGVITSLGKLYTFDLTPGDYHVYASGGEFAESIQLRPLERDWQISSHSITANTRALDFTLSERKTVQLEVMEDFKNFEIKADFYCLVIACGESGGIFSSNIELAQQIRAARRLTDYRGEYVRDLTVEEIAELNARTDSTMKSIVEARPSEFDTYMEKMDAIKDGWDALYNRLNDYVDSSEIMLISGPTRVKFETTSNIQDQQIMIKVAHDERCTVMHVIISNKLDGQVLYEGESGPLEMDARFTISGPYDIEVHFSDLQFAEGETQTLIAFGMY